ncbi:MAG: hypothetical protein KDA37_14990, partial [Planctomycetales bacterium]|nr:hypothetical protein [Planctomycetales bacterium]
MPRKPRRKAPHRQTRRHSQLESLGSREVMSADPLGGFLGGAISHHSFTEEVQHHAIAEASSLEHHDQIDQIELDHHTMPPADFWLDEQQPTLSLDEQLEQIEKALFSAHQLTGMDHVKTDYGFTGAGQTVAIIDSGIA